VSDFKPIEGGCVCGTIRYRITGAPRLVSACHCSICRKASGAPMVVWLTVKKPLVEILSGTPAWYKSSEHGRRGFCAACGTQIVSTHDGYANYYELTAGSLDDPGAVTLERHVFAHDRIEWLKLCDGLPRHVADARSPLIDDTP
jgi:hypothetical protein